MALARLGRFEESRAALQAALKIVQSINSPITESDVELFAGWANLDMGDTQRGLAHGQRGVQLAVATDNFDCICAGSPAWAMATCRPTRWPRRRRLPRRHRTDQGVGALRFEVLAAADWP
jgi:hypothetical protein